MHPPPPAADAMDFSQNSLFGYMEDLQELTIIERPVRRSLKTPEEIERLTVDEDLSDIERAVYLLSAGQDIQGTSVIANLPFLVRQNPAETLRRVLPKVRGGNFDSLIYHGTPRTCNSAWQTNRHPTVI
uniref:Protein phosphatase 4 regulatory subunit 4 n=1 Tax=Felis catus TaxID=9685 RepID=A0ABI7XWX1_FELCA